MDDVLCDNPFDWVAGLIPPHKIDLAYSKIKECGET